ncbi:conserved hypothetical protein [Frankia sp. AiPs1]|uniref:hypothetical protein n=1 Tax=Frankia sp. AiPa1 TaxID=573492 RepID=UPI00202AF7F0|nr:hypothetical protein [Frankia sp. AiPa1]MCL9762485.1 hypothetical protein [Frankia sp. AiPa1]
MAENIVIDEPTLIGLRNKYQGLLDDIDTRMTDYQWGTNPDSRLSLGDEFTLRLGGADFVEAVGLAKDLGKIREKLAGRVDSTYSDATNLRWGLEYLLQDTDAVEHLTTMSAQEFQSFIPVSTTSATEGSGGQTGS